MLLQANTAIFIIFYLFMKRDCFRKKKTFLFHSEVFVKIFQYLMLFSILFSIMGQDYGKRCLNKG